MTVAAQKDIWPHGNTYPTKAVAIEINKIVTPDIQRLVNFHEEFMIFFKMWPKIKKKKAEAPLIWKNRTNQPM